jgi:NAD(P)-dependent dehydrogenase (short-subunit alcohol dehydrogenase family)
MGAQMELAGKVAVVTGGGRGIGRGIVDRFLEEGARVAIAQRSTLDDVLDMDPQVLHIPADLSDTAQLASVVERTVEAFGGLHILVNSAGLMFERTVAALTTDDWESMVAVNLRAPLFLAQAALPHLEGGGSIINIGSTEGLASNPGHTVYSATKGGIHAMTRALAVDLGEHGVRCNAIAPGWITSDLSETYIESMTDPQAARAELRRLHPVGRLGEPQDIGNLAVFLASDRSSFISGETIVVDGGRTAKLPTPA